MEKVSRWVNILSVVLGVLVALPWTFFWWFGLAWIIDSEWEYLWLIPNAVAGFLVPWGLVQAIARFARLRKRDLKVDDRPASSRVIVTSIIAGVVFAIPLGAVCAFLITYMRLDDLAYLWLIPVGAAGFMVPWGLVRVLERPGMHREGHQPTG